ncbi:hypothetical protein EOM60_05135 [Candidatus Saccharibacteria bacterium]|nr:hypothetical protein [Candidatus Saccharibacteria bacterium]
MGIFGPSPEEQSLRIQLDEANSKNEVIGRQLSGTRDLLAVSQEELARAKIVNQLTEVAERALRAAENSGAVQISAAQTAEDIVKARYITHAEAFIANTIIGDHTDAICMRRGPDWDDEITKRLTEQYTRDGTFERIQNEVDAAAIKEIADCIRGEYIAEQEEINRTPEKQAQLRAELEASGKIDEIREAILADLEKEWREEASSAIFKKIEAELAAGEEAYKEDWEEKWRGSYEGRQHVEKTMYRLKKEWAAASTEEVARKIEDEELLRLLAERAEREKRELNEEAFYGEYLSDFGGEGIDVRKIPPGSDLTIYLGYIEDAMSRDRYGGKVKDGLRVAVQRLVRLTKLDGEKFRIEGDSLKDSASPYERSASLKYGDVVYIGRKVTDNGSAKLEPSLREGVPLFLDDAKEDQSLVPTYLPVANVEMNGISAIKDLKEPRIIKCISDDK